MLLLLRRRRQLKAVDNARDWELQLLVVAATQALLLLLLLPLVP